MDFHELMEWLDQMLWIGIDNSWCLLGVIYDIVKSFLVWSIYDNVWKCPGVLYDRLLWTMFGCMDRKYEIDRQMKSRRKCTG